MDIFIYNKLYDLIFPVDNIRIEDDILISKTDGVITRLWVDNYKADNVIRITPGGLIAIVRVEPPYTEAEVLELGRELAGV